MRDEIVKQRLQQILNETGCKKSDLAKAANVRPQAVNNWFNNGKISIDSARAISDAFGYNTDWILGGAGVAILNSNINNSPITNNVGAEQQRDITNLVQGEQDDEHYHCLKYLDVRAAAGLVEYSNEDYPEIIRSVWLSDDGLLELVGKRTSRGLRIINVPTDSMEPTIPKGSPVIIDTYVNGYIGDGIYAFSINGNLFIKRLQKLIKGGYLVISDNKPKYRDEEMESEFIDNARFVGKFVRVWKIETEDL